MNTLYLHIGIPKTGTSAIQAFLYDNSEYLRKKGLYYPAKDSDLENILSLFNDECSKKEKNKFSSIAKQYISGRYLKYRLSVGNAGLLSQFKGDDVYKYFTIVSSLAFSEKCDMLLSSEKLYSVPDKTEYFEQLKRLPLNIKVIVYLRRQDEFVSSVINQLFKNGTKIKTINYLDCLNECHIDTDIFDYFKELEKIAKVIGRENIIVRRYYKGIDIIPDFLSIFNITLDENYIMPSKPINPPLSKSCIKIMYFVNKFVSDGNIRKLISFFLLDISVKFSKSSSNTFLWDESVRKEILDKYEESNNKLAQLYLGEEKLFDR